MATRHRCVRYGVERSRVREWLNYIGGRWTAAAAGRTTTLHDPGSTSEVVATAASSSAEDVVQAVDAARAAQAAWAATPPSAREAMLRRFADLVEADVENLARTVTLEQGKPLAESRGEIAKAVAETRFMAGEAQRLHGVTAGGERPGTDAFSIRVPLGSVAAINPWNFPVSTPLRKAIPALVTGNTVILKPSELTPGPCAELVRYFEEAGLPPGVVNLVIGDGPEVGRPLVDSDGVDGVSFTGSTAVGRELYQRAARRLIPVQLEMGGKNPAIVSPSANLPAAVSEIAQAALLTCGQRCTAISRVIAHEDVVAEVRERLEVHLGGLAIGHGLDPSTQLGPLVSAEQLGIIEGWVEQGIADGARLVCGGHRPKRPDGGWYYTPTLLDGVTADMAIAREEVFGPVIVLLSYRSFDEAMDVCNDVAYGLSACLFSRDLREIDVFSRTAQAGMLHINRGTTPQSHLPFGGVKDSGVGAYSVGSSAVDFFTTVQTVYRAAD